MYTKRLRSPFLKKTPISSQNAEHADNKVKSWLSVIRRPTGKSQLHLGTCPSPSSSTVLQLPSASNTAEDALSGEEAMEVEVSEQQKVAMEEEERVLAEQIENQKENENLTVEMLVPDPRATLESEASIGTAHSSENLNAGHERDTPGRNLAIEHKRTETGRHR